MNHSMLIVSSQMEHFIGMHRVFYKSAHVHECWLLIYYWIIKQAEEKIKYEACEALNHFSAIGAWILDSATWC